MPDVQEYYSRSSRYVSVPSRFGSGSRSGSSGPAVVCLDSSTRWLPPWTNESGSLAWIYEPPWPPAWICAPCCYWYGSRTTAVAGLDPQCHVVAGLDLGAPQTLAWIYAPPSFAGLALLAWIHAPRGHALGPGRSSDAGLDLRAQSKSPAWLCAPRCCRRGSTRLAASVVDLTRLVAACLPGPTRRGSQA